MTEVQFEFHPIAPGAEVVTWRRQYRLRLVARIVAWWNDGWSCIAGIWKARTLE